MIPSNIRDIIINTYQKEPDLEIEVEVRFGDIFNDIFKSGVDIKTFNSVKNYLDEIFDPIFIKTIDYKMNNIRKTIDENGNVFWIIKEKIFNKIYNTINYSISIEKNINPMDMKFFIPDTIRNKKRFSYIIFEKSISIDLTEINTDKDENIFEIEIELLKPYYLNEFESAISNTYKIILNTKVLNEYNTIF